MAPVTSKGQTLIALMRHLEMRKMVILTSTQSLWFQGGLGLTTTLQAAGMQVLRPAAFEPGLNVKVQETTLSHIKHSGYRCVMLIAYDAEVQALASTAQHQQMNTGWAWILPWTDQLTAPVQRLGWLYVRPFLDTEDMHAFAEQVSEYSKSFFNTSTTADSVDLVHSAALHDAIMLYAHAVTKLLSKGGDWQDGQAVTTAMRSTTFMGAGGTVVALDQRGDRLESYEVMNYVVVGTAGEISSVPIGWYNMTSQQYRGLDRVVVWPGNTTDIPADYTSGACYPFASVCRTS